MTQISTKHRDRRSWNWGLTIKLTVALLAVGVLSFHLRDLSVNLTIPVLDDEAQYVGAARDFLESGTFAETTHHLSLPHFLPLGYPALIVATAWLTGFSPHMAALAVNLIAGTILPLAVLLLVWRMGGGWLGAVMAGVLAALNWELVLLSGRAMTDTVYMVLVLVTAWVLWESLAERWRDRLIWIGLLLGLLFGGLYQVRVSALCLLPAIILLYLGFQWRLRLWSWPLLLKALSLFLLIGMGVIALTSYRLYRLNGFYALSPQIAGNMSIGDFMSGRGDQLMRLDPSGRSIVRRIQQRQGTDLLGPWLRDPLGELHDVRTNLETNLALLWQASWKGLKGWRWWLPIILLLLLATLWRYRAGKGRPAPAPRLARALVVLVVFTASHILLYSMGVHWKRYMVQQVPLLLVMLGLLWGRTFSKILAEQFVGPKLNLKLDGGWRRLTLRGEFGLTIGWPGTCLLALLLGIPLLMATSMFEYTWPELIQRDRVSDSARYNCWAQGKAIASLSQGMSSPRIICDNWSIPYYAHGEGVEIPFTESDPQRLLAYLRFHKVRFVSVMPFNAFADRFFGVPLAMLMQALSRLPEAPVEAVYPPGNRAGNWPFYRINRQLALKVVQRRKRFPRGEHLNLASGRRYLLFARFRSSSKAVRRFRIHGGVPGNQRRRPLPRQRVLTLPPEPIFCLSARGVSRRPLAASLASSPLELPNQTMAGGDSPLASGEALPDHTVWYYQYAAFDTGELASPRLSLCPDPLPAPLQGLDSITLYQLVTAE